MSDQSMPRPPVRLIVLGGIGAGKSAVMERLARLGATVVDADEIGHGVIAPGGPAHAEVARRWPSAVRDEIVDREALASLVFADAGELRELEAITHPKIVERIKELVEGSQAPLVAVELPVRPEMLGPGWLRLVVEAPRDLRLERAVSRGLSEADVERRMAAQPADEERRVNAQFVIMNDSTIAELHSVVDELWARLVPDLYDETEPFG